jgi:hypothetical protein
MAAVSGAVVTRANYGHQCAICPHKMCAGNHYAEFTVLSTARSNSALPIGVVAEGFGDGACQIAWNSPHGWMLWVNSSYDECLMYHDGTHSTWTGHPRRVQEGDIVGLLLDLESQTIRVYLNGRRHGLMVSPGMQNCRGGAVASLVGPLRWAADVGDGASVRIERKPFPHAASQGERCNVQ